MIIKIQATIMIIPSMLLFLALTRCNTSNEVDLTVMEEVENERDYSEDDESKRTRNCHHDKTSFRCISYISNYDGDTAKFLIPGANKLIDENVSVRINGVDTAEMRTKNGC